MNPIRIPFICALLVGQLLIASAVSASEEAVHVSTRSLSATMAVKLAEATYRDCTDKGYSVAVAVVNREGRLIAFMRNPLSGVHVIKVSQGKAETAATFKTSTQQLMGREFMRDIPGAMIWGGGLPINVGGHFYGGIGVAGAPEKKTPGDTDHECAAAGIKYITEEIEMAD